MRLTLKHLALAGVTLVAAFGLVFTPLMQPSADAAGTCRSRTLRYGSRGTCVKYVQIMSNAMASNRPWAGNNLAGGRVIAADGVYGPNTRYEVIVMQRWFNSWHKKRDHVYVDGVVGNQTWRLYCSYAYKNHLSGYWAHRANEAGRHFCGW